MVFRSWVLGLGRASSLIKGETEMHASRPVSSTRVHAPADCEAEAPPSGNSSGLMPVAA